MRGRLWLTPYSSRIPEAEYQRLITLLDRLSMKSEKTSRTRSLSLMEIVSRAD
jgi:predicted DNA-binding protein